MSNEMRYYEIELVRVVERTEKCVREVQAASYDEALAKAKAVIAADWFDDGGSTVVSGPEPTCYHDPYRDEDAEERP